MPFRVKRSTKFLIFFILLHGFSRPLAEISRSRLLHKQSGIRGTNTLSQLRTAFPEDCLISCLDWPHCLGVSIRMNDTEGHSTECEPFQEISDDVPVVYVVSSETWLSFLISGIWKWALCNVS